MSARQVTLLEVQCEVMREWQVPLSALHGRQRRSETMLARQVCFWLALGVTGRSAAQIARAMGVKESFVTREASALHAKLGQDSALNTRVHAMERRLLGTDASEAAA